MRRRSRLSSDEESASSEESSDQYNTTGRARHNEGLGFFDGDYRRSRGSLGSGVLASPGNPPSARTPGQKTNNRLSVGRSSYDPSELDLLVSPQRGRRTSSGIGTTTSASATPMSPDNIYIPRNTSLGQGQGSAHRRLSKSEQGHEADTEGADAESEFAAVWEAVMRDDAPAEERPVHIERELQPYRVIATGLALGALVWVLKHQAFEPKSMGIAFLVMVFGEYLSDFSWFQVVSGLSIGMIFAIVIVLLAVVRRYSKPSALGGAIALGCIKFKLNIRHIFRIIAIQLGVDVSEIAIPVLAISGVFLFIASSIWYCTASFPVVRFQKFLKFFLSVIIGGGMICYSFYSKCPDATLEMKDEKMAYNSLSWGDLFEKHHMWIGASAMVYLILTFAFKWAVLRHTVDDIVAMVDEKYGANKVMPVKNYVGFKSPAEVRRTSQDFTKMQLDLLHKQIAAMPREQLADMVSPDAYFQLTQQPPNPSILSNKVAIGYSILILMLVVAYVITSWISGDALFEIPL